MVKSNKNQCANTSNPYQGTAKRVLCVCSAGLLRSPTAAKVLQQEYGYNTRSCGVNEEYALIPISEALVLWAQEIVFMEKAHLRHVQEHLDNVLWRGEIVILDIEDDYSYCDKELILKIKEKYSAST